MSLIEFVLARIAEDEEIVRLKGITGRRVERGQLECEAKRRIVELHRAKDNGFCTHCNWKWPCVTLRLLALPYADHPDYQPEWRV
jgi:hypothetical protein